ncbi:hypothetical protein SLS62_008427 [Diatrype stigma]|uniref:Fucose-specific lectin n=1 Tax=Diatrype stigma TaxID=117547 RepID=A0AAN9UJ31_9PEZI
MAHNAQSGSGGGGYDDGSYSTLEVNTSQPQPPPPGYSYSDLEVDDSRLPESVVTAPSVVASSNPDLDYPEVVYPAGYQGVKAYDGYAGAAGGAEAAPMLAGGAAAAAAAGGPRILGLRRKTFWILVAVGAVIIVAVVVGVAAGLLIPRGSSANASDSDVNATVLLSNTKLASANFTDAQNNDNYIVVYQLQNRAIYLSAYNSSTNKWVVSPVIDNTTSISVDTVQEETGLGLDVYFHDGNTRDVHLYWQAPDSTLRTAMYRSNLSTTAALDPSRWEDPYSIQDRYSGLSGSSLASYGHQCDQCTPWTYFFWQGAEGAVHGAWRTTDSEDGWGDITFTQGVTKPVANTSLAVTNVPSTDATRRSIDVFYQASSGVLTQIAFDGEEGYQATALPRGDLGERASIVAFATGWDESDTDANTDLEPVGFQVLSVNRDDSGAGGSVQLTYYQDGSWTAGSDVAELADCATHASMAANLGRRVYCVVDGDGDVPQIVEWSWAATPTGNTADYTNYKRVGVVDTPV